MINILNGVNTNPHKRPGDTRPHTCVCDDGVMKRRVLPPFKYLLHTGLKQGRDFKPVPGQIGQLTGLAPHTVRRRVDVRVTTSCKRHAIEATIIAP